MSSFSFSTTSDNVNAAAATKAESTTPRTIAADDGDEELMPWEEENWVPKTGGGKQKSPNQIRKEFQHYLDTCGRTQASVLQEIRIKNKSFREFMNPKTNKAQKSGVGAFKNETYWAAAKLLAKEEHLAKQEAGSSKKRKPTTATAGATAAGPAAKKTTKKTESRAEAEAWLQEVMMATPEVAETTVVYDSCPDVVKKIKQCFKNHPGLTRAAFCKVALQGSNNNALTRFLGAKGQGQSGNQVYPRAYAFFERLRVHDHQAKTKARLKNEAEQGASGFSTKPAKIGRPAQVLHVRGIW